MLLRIDIKAAVADRVRGERLRSFNMDERDLQGILFRSLDKLFPDDELILIAQSRRWQEEPDLVAIDGKGNLYLFELKAWESNPGNLLQVLRYGQIFGSDKYDALARMYRKHSPEGPELREVHRAKFDVQLREEEFNKKQVFIVMTNGVDTKTREAIQYWRSCGLDMRPWIYRLYKLRADDFYLEMVPFRVI